MLWIVTFTNQTNQDVAKPLSAIVECSDMLGAADLVEAHDAGVRVVDVVKACDGPIYRIG